tara:strand:+ start:817 stop:1335 length:519 start_codon:yes stop_codon:yes gene_type:complete
MIYTVNNKQGKFTKSEIDLCEIPSKIITHIKSKISLSDYYILIDDGKYCIVGFLKISKDFWCVIDMFNSGFNAKCFFKFINYVLDSIKANLYAVPNQNGQFVWEALGFKKSFLKFKFTLNKIPYYRFCYNNYKYLFINQLFLPTPSRSMKKYLKKYIYYNKQIPDKIILDTF